MKRQREWESDEPASSSDPRSGDLGNAKVVKCPYLDTINRPVLDFDSEKLCSQTLTNRNVYVCLVCGKFFEGRGKSTPAYTHSVDQGHYVFMNLESGRSYCLPDLYEIHDQSLSDIRKCLAPQSELHELVQLQRNSALSRDIHGVSYLPGCMGLNNLNATDDVNAVLHLLGHIYPLRDFFLQHGLYKDQEHRLLQEFGLVIRKLWSAHNFKSTVSPQELVQRITVESKRRFSIGQRVEAIDLLIWLLATLHKQLEGPKVKPGAADSVLYEPIQGTIEVTTFTKPFAGVLEGQQPSEDGWTRTIQVIPFNFLSLDIPPCPLFRNSHGSYVIPQIPLFQLLHKFDGTHWTDSVTQEAHIRKCYRIKTLPRYLILQLVRFTKNNFTLEKNPTIVTFPVRNLELRDYVFVGQQPLSAQQPSDMESDDAEAVDESLLTTEQLNQRRLLADCPSSAVELQDKSTSELCSFIDRFGAPLHRKEKDLALQRHRSNNSNSDESAALHADLLLVVQRCVERVQLFGSTKYDLVSSVCHVSDGSAKDIEVGTETIASAKDLSKKKPASAAGGSSSTQSTAAGATKISGSGGSNSSVATTTTGTEVVQRGSYKVHLSVQATGQWFEVQDLNVTETSAQQIGVSESYLLVYEKKLPSKLAS